MRKGQQLDLAELEALPTGSRVIDSAEDIMVKQADGTLTLETGHATLSAAALEAAWGPIRFYDVPDPEEYPYTGAVVLVFDGPPGHQSGRFLEAEDENGRSIKVGEWRNRGDGTWELRLERPTAPADHPTLPGMEPEFLTTEQAEALFPIAPSLNEPRPPAPLSASKHAGLRELD